MRFVNDYGKTRSFNPRPSVRGDMVVFPSPLGLTTFQSTPLREGRLAMNGYHSPVKLVSIHAPP